MFDKLQDKVSKKSMYKALKFYVKKIAYTLLKNCIDIKQYNNNLFTQKFILIFFISYVFF